MTQSCEAIIIILALMMIVFFRKKKSDYAISLIPLFLIPLAQVISNHSTEYLAKLFGFNSHRMAFYTIMIIAMLIVSILVIVFSYKFFDNKLIKKFYAASTLSFSVILSLILIYNI